MKGLDVEARVQSGCHSEDSLSKSSWQGEEAKFPSASVNRTFASFTAALIRRLWTRLDKDLIAFTAKWRYTRRGNEVIFFVIYSNWQHSAKHARISVMSGKYQSKHIIHGIHINNTAGIIYEAENPKQWRENNLCMAKKKCFQIWGSWELRHFWLLTSFGNPY